VDAIYILIGASLPIAIGFLIAFIRSAKAGQFDDACTPAIRMLMDDELTSNQDNQNQSTL
jgi:cbb3-type cytochrome oxidase maturation protein